MALSFIQWEKYIQGFPDERLGEEFKNPGSTVPGMAPPPQNLIVSEMGNRNAARKADEAMQASQGQPTGTIAEQTYDEFVGEDRPVGGPGGGPPPGGPGGPPPMGPGGPPPGGPPLGGPPMGPGGPPPGGPPMGPGGPPMGGPPMGPGGPPMMAYGGLVPRYQEGGDTEKPGFWSGLGRWTTGAGSWKEAMENPFSTAARSALSLAMLHPAGRLIGGTGRIGLGLLGRGTSSGALSALGRGTLALGEKGGLRGGLARLLAGKKRMTQYGRPGEQISVARRIPGPPSSAWGRFSPRGVKEGRAAVRETTRWPKGHPKAGQIKPGAKLKTLDERLKAVRAPRVSEFDIGRMALLRGGGLGIAGLVALDPFDAREEEDTAPAGPPPTTDLTKSSAIRADRSKGFANGGYDWVDEEGSAQRDLRELIEYRKAGVARGDFPEDFQDRVNQAWLDRQDFSDDVSYVAPRQGYATLPEMASGGIIGLGYHEGGSIPIHGHGGGEGQHLVTNRNPGDGWKLGWDPEGDLATPEGTYASGERDIPSDIGRWLRRRHSDVYGGVQGLTTGIANIYEAMREGQQFGPELRNDEGKLLWTGMENASGDRKLYDPAIEGWSGEKTWRLDPIDGAETGAGSSQGGPKDISGVERVVEGVGEVGAPSVEAALPSEDVDQKAADIANRMTTEAQAYQNWLRKQTPGEFAQDEYWADRARREKGSAFGIMAADVADSIAAAGEPGGIGRGLAKAIRNQVTQGRLISDYEGLPITAAAARSRASTFEAQQGILKDVYSALTSRGEIDATVQGRLQEVWDSLAETRRMTPENMQRIHALLMDMEVRELISKEGMKSALRQLSALSAHAAGMTIPLQ